MDRWIELSRTYRQLLCTASTFEDALAGFPDLGADKRTVLGWFDDIRLCDLGQGVDIIHVELGGSPRGFEISAWRWADHLMLIDEGLIEPHSIRTIMVPGIVHPGAGLACRGFADPETWLFFCSFVPIELLASADLQSKWGIDREFAVLFCLGDAIFHGGFVTPSGWKRPLKIVEVPPHSH